VAAPPRPPVPYEPDADLPPDQFPEALQLETGLATDQVMVLPLPCAILEGDELIETTGAGATTVTVVVEAGVVPPGPLQVSEKLLAPTVVKFPVD
jgi:hypothetical protein